MSSREMSPINVLNYKTGGDLAIGQLVAVDTDGAAIAATDGSALAFPLITKAKDGSCVDVQTGQIAKVRVGAAVAVGDQLVSDGDSKAIAASSGDIAFGRALTVAAAADEYVQVLLGFEELA